MKAIVAMFLFVNFLGLNLSLYRKHIFVNQKKDWKDAVKYCRKHYKDLSIVSGAELETLSDNPDISDSYYWIGLGRDKDIPTLWRWVNGEIATINDWDNNQGNDFSEKCVTVRKDTSKLHDYSCNLDLQFYCMMDFDLILKNKTWEEALDYCREQDSDLASLCSDKIMEAAVKIIEEAETVDVWTGLRFMAGQWFWANGDDLVYKAWSNEGELQCPAGNQRCGALNREEKVWKPADCERRLRFLCTSKQIT